MKLENLEQFIFDCNWLLNEGKQIIKELYNYETIYYESYFDKEGNFIYDIKLKKYNDILKSYVRHELNLLYSIILFLRVHRDLLFDDNNNSNYSSLKERIINDYDKYKNIKFNDTSEFINLIFHYAYYIYDLVEKNKFNELK